MLKTLILSIFGISAFLYSFGIIAETNNGQSTVYYIGTNDLKATNERYARNVGIKLIELNLDGHRNLEKIISDGLPLDDFETAERIANERLEKLDPMIVRESFQGIALTVQWGIQKTPAFVFNEGQYVIYGVTDVEQALKRWEYFRMRQ